MKILQITNGLGLGGAETMTMNVYRNIDRTRYQFDFIVVGDGKGYYEEEALELGAQVFHLPKRSESFLKYHKELYKIIKNNKYDIVQIHAQNAFFSGVMAFVAKRAGIKKIIGFSHNSQDWRSRPLILLHKLSRNYFRNCLTVKCSCGKEAAEWLYGTDKDVLIIPVPVNCKNLMYSDDLYYETRNKFSYNNKMVFLHMGRFADVKNHDFLIDIFSEIYKKNKSTELVLIGVGEKKEIIEKKVSSLGLDKCVKFCGSVPDTSEYLIMADGFIFPSKYEGFPAVVLEAQAAGLKCFVSDTVTPNIKITEYVKFISLDKSAQEWASLILNNMDTAIDRRNCNNLVASNYDVESVAQRFMHVYDQC